MDEKQMIHRKAFIFAGVNGAGKTTLYYDKLLQGEFFGARINADEFVRSFGSDKNPHEQARAMKIALKFRKTCIQKWECFNQETTLCGKGVVRFFKGLRQNNYAITLFFIGLNDAQIAIERVQARVTKGGHSVEKKLIIKRFDESLRNLLKIIEFCEEFYLYDNSGVNFKEILSFRRKAHYHNAISSKERWIYRYKKDIELILRRIEINKTNIIAYLKGLKAKLKKEGISKIGLFGSFAKDEATIYSDIDIAYECNAEFHKKFKGGFEAIGFLEDLREEIEKHFGISVDLCHIGSIQPEKRQSFVEGMIWV